MNNRFAIIAAVLLVPISACSNSSGNGGNDGSPRDAGVNVQADASASQTDARTAGPGSIVLPDGQVLDLPDVPDTNGAYDCAASDVLCVPAEYATPQLAADAVAAGDTVVVEAGSYPGFVVTNSGSAGNPIRFVARPGVTIDTFPIGMHGIVLQSDFDNDFYVDHIYVVGFAIQAPPGRCIYLTKAIASRPTVGHLLAQNTCVNAGREGLVLSQMSLSVVQDNVIINAGNGSAVGELDHGIYLSNGGTGSSLVRRNVIVGSSTNGIHFNGDRFVDTGGTDGIISNMVLDGNIIVGNGQNGFNMDGVQQSLFTNNVFYGNARHAMRGYAIDGAEGPKGIVAINNTCIENNSCVKLSDSLGGHVVFNNLFVDMRDEPIVVPGADLTEAANLASTTIEFNSLPTSLDTASAAQIAAFDFGVTAASIAQVKDQGQASAGGKNAPERDMLGAARVGLPDIGAVEY